MSETASIGHLRVGLAQVAPEPDAPDANLDRIEARLAEAGDVDLMVWPELYLSGYTTDSVAARAEPLDGPRVARLCALAATYDTALVVGFCEDREGGTANSALAIDRDGRLAGCYRKTQLFGDEDKAFVAGDAWRTVSLCGVRIGLMICFDIEFPEIARALAVDDARMLVAISANMTPFGPDHRLCIQARALENRRPMVYVNQVGQGERFLFAGQSAVADNAGQIIDECSGTQNDYRVVDVPLDIETEIRPDYLALRRRALAVVRDDSTA